MTQKPGLLELTFHGEDPRLAMDLRNDKALPVGPYVLAFKLNKAAGGGGEVFYTTDNKTVLPKRNRIDFPIDGSGGPQDVRIPIPTDQSLKQIRLDVSDGPGSASLRNLRLLDSEGRIIKDWTPEKPKG